MADYEEPPQVGAADDDQDTGLTSRRKVLGAIGGLGIGATALGIAAGAAAGQAGATETGVAGAGAAEAGAEGGVRPAAYVPACVLSPESIEGPYYIDSTILRSNITEGKPGVPLRLQLVVSNARTCTPIKDAAVDVWHCDAVGQYSGFLAGTARPGTQGVPTDPSRFLRGTQVSDATGATNFVTVYPGWYQGRAIHIHIKVHVGGSTVHTGQLYFSDSLSDQIARLQPYASHTIRRLRNYEDMIYRSSGGASTTLTLTPLGGSITDGYRTSIVVGVDPYASPA
ncbi:intradiol ring-cleavage dioxygenase [Goodfellowiella coeruleoviolacea]|uniref:Dioxygenase n=1 Tax=Goodfellowiella coeruleoviolacea TaxID=334858 RepID=A0AAE3GF80_9PSEU|nr:intradiol ring-cleavage dioxygenase [Goodfellowiella coeruleoviolacea]MCP2167020.1 Dioxygenase [Goodfellowiella coeruleoviolacea]